MNYFSKGTIQEEEGRGRGRTRNLTAVDLEEFRVLEEEELNGRTERRARKLTWEGDREGVAGEEDEERESRFVTSEQIDDMLRIDNLDDSEDEEQSRNKANFISELVAPNFVNPTQSVLESQINRLNNEAGIVKPLSMAKLKENLRKEKKNDAVKAISQKLSQKVIKFNFSEQSLSEERRLDHVLQTPESDLPDVDYNDTKVLSLIKSIQIDKKIIKSLMGSRFVNSLENYEKLPKEKAKSIIQEEKQEFISMQLLFTEIDSASISESKAVEFMSSTSKVLKRYKSFLEDSNLGLSLEVSPIEIDEDIMIQKHLNQNLVGNITCFNSTSFYLLIGTDAGEILQIGFKESSKPKKYIVKGEITSLDTSEDSQMWAAGTSEGSLIIREALGGWGKRDIGSFCGGEPISTIRFFTKREAIIATHRNIKRISLTSLKLAITVAEENIFQANDADIEGVLPLVINETLLLVISTINCVSFYKNEKPSGLILEAEIPRPDSIEKGWAPSLSSLKLKIDSNEIYVPIIWKRFAFLVKIELDNIHVEGMKTFSKDIIWGTVLHNRLLATIDSELKLEIKMVDHLFTTAFEQNTQEIKDFCGDIELPREIITCGVRHAINPNARDLDWFDRIKGVSDGVGFVAAKRFVKARLITASEMVNKHRNSMDYLGALEICIQIAKQRILTDEYTRKEINEVTPAIVVEYLNTAASNESENMTRMMLIAMEALTDTNNVQYLLGELQEQFSCPAYWNSLEECIKAGRIDDLPLEVFMKGLQFISGNSLSVLALRLSPNAFLGQEGLTLQLMNVLIQKKQWSALHHLAFGHPKHVLEPLLVFLLCKAEGLDTSTRDNIYEKSIKGELDMPSLSGFEKGGAPPDYLWVFWILWKIFTWNNMDNSFSLNQREETYIVAFRWILTQRSFISLFKLHPQLTLELCYTCLTNFEFLTSDNLINEIESIYSTEHSTKDLLSESAKVLGSPCKLVFMIEGWIPDLFQSDLVYFRTKLLNLRFYSGLLEEGKKVKACIRMLIGRKFIPNQLWLYYNPVEKSDFEAAILNVIDLIDSERELLILFNDLAESNE